MTRRVDYGTVQQHVGFHIHLTWRAIRKRLLGRKVAGDMPPARGSYSVPILIGLNPGINPQELAQALHLDASKVAFVLKGLEQDGLVCRTPSQADRRRVGLTLTEAGTAFAAEATWASAIMEDPIGATITAEERNELIRILTKIRDGTRAGQD